jgi:hypothetical protein
MTTLMSKQLLAYHDSVTRASNVAIECWDLHKSVQEMILMSPGMVASIRAVTTTPKISADPNDRQEAMSTCEGMLTSLNSLAQAAVKLREHNFELAGLPELRDAITQLRFLMADILDANTGVGGQPPAEVSAEDFRTMCRDMPPPQSWYEEDFKGLWGPCGQIATKIEWARAKRLSPAGLFGRQRSTAMGRTPRSGPFLSYLRPRMARSAGRTTEPRPDCD